MGRQSCGWYSLAIDSNSFANKSLGNIADVCRMIILEKAGLHTRTTNERTRTNRRTTLDQTRRRFPDNVYSLCLKKSTKDVILPFDYHKGKKT